MAISTVGLTSVNAGSVSAGNPQGGNAQGNPLAPLRDKQSSAVTQLSVFGRIQLSLEDLQAKAQALQNINNPPTLSDFKVAVQAVVQSFNALNQTVSDAAAKRAAPAEDERPGRVVSELRKAIAGPEGNGYSQLQKVGISQQQDNSLTIDSNRLDSAFVSDQADTLTTLAGIFSRVEKTAGNQTTSNDNNGSKINNLSDNTSRTNESGRSDQARLAAQKSAQQRLAAELANADSYPARNAVATYFNVASL